MTRRRICILSLSEIARDGRVLRQIEHAARAYDVTVVGWGKLPGETPHVTVRSVEPQRFAPPRRALRAITMLAGRVSPDWWWRWYWAKPDHRAALHEVAASACDLVHANEAVSLPIAIRAASRLGVPVLFDAHEYTPLQRENRMWWRIIAKPFYQAMFRDLAPRADAMTTVAPGIADRYRAHYGLHPTVVMNAAAYEETAFRPVDPDRIGLVHHGIATRNRSPGALIDLMRLLDKRYRLTLMLIDRENHLSQLRGRAQAIARDRVRFRDPVPPAEIVSTISDHDIAVALIPPVTFSYAHALPNKFFESLMAGLAVAVGPSPEMAQIIGEHRCGAVADTFSVRSMAGLLNDLKVDEINAMKRASLAAARTLNAEVEMAKVLSIYERLMSQWP